jgi:catechol 2,3-dioxygenase-like lactoylglutathione lyase family enzyme
VGPLAVGGKAMGLSIGSISLLVRDYDEAIAFFTGRLGFALIEDTPLGDGKRWVVVGPHGGGATLLLARAVNPDQESRIGDQSSGRVLLFLHSDDFWRDYASMKSRGVCFAEEPRREAYGTVVVFLDLYGNKWDLVQPNTPNEPKLPPQRSAAAVGGIG